MLYRKSIAFHVHFEVHFYVYLRNNFNWQMTFSECWKYDLNLSFYGFRAWGQIVLKNLWEGGL